MNTELAAYQKAVEAAKEQIAQLTHARDAAEKQATILQAQLGGWEAACAAQVRAARIYLAATDDMAHTGPQLAARGRLANAIDSNAGELLLKRLAMADAVIGTLREWRTGDVSGGALTVALAQYDAAVKAREKQ